MRQILFFLSLEHPWSGWTPVPGGLPTFGACWVILIAAGLYFAYQRLRWQRAPYRDKLTWINLGIVVLLVSLLGPSGFFPATLPIFGYGMMVLLGFLAGLDFALHRALAVGWDPDLILDAAFWILISGILGGRLAYLAQYADHVFKPGASVGQQLWNVVNLAEGGLVLIGGLVGGLIGFLAFCAKRHANKWELADLIIPAAFIGIGFGRIGCLLNGCCYGDRCELPWAITFPAGSVTHSILADRGFIDPQSPRTFPLHPTQLYSSLGGFILAIVTGTYYWYRRYPGDVFALGCILYPITRFLIEFLRADEMGQLGTGLTISQIYSLGIFAVGIVIMLTGPWRARHQKTPQLAPSTAVRRPPE